MRAMNHAVDVEKRDVVAVVRDFLGSQAIERNEPLKR
jgi:hypothetical protein